MMIRTIVLALTIIYSIVSSVGAADPKPPSQDVFEVRVRGFLQQSPPDDKDGSRFAYSVESRGIPVRLVFTDASKAELLEPMLKQLVEFSGELLRQSDGKIVCQVKGDVKLVKLTQYLVGYEAGELDAVKKRADELGLSVSDDYRPGKYLIMIPRSKLDNSSLERLKKSPGVRYVEENQEVSIKQLDGNSGPKR